MCGPRARRAAATACRSSRHGSERSRAGAGTGAPRAKATGEMPPATRSAPAHGRRPAASAGRPPRGRPRVLAGGAGAIRWDRVSRVALLVVVVVLVLLYAGPARSY